MAKQNITTIRNARYVENEKRGIGHGKSKYAKKVAAGNQMYGPGCCAHRVKLRSAA